MEARVRLDGGDEVSELVSLWAWLNDEDELRGRVRRVDKPIGPTELGGVVDVLTVALGSGGAGAVLGQSLITWLRTRRAHVTLTISVGDRTARLDATNLAASQVDGMLDMFRHALADDDER